MGTTAVACLTDWRALDHHPIGPAVALAAHWSRRTTACPPRSTLPPAITYSTTETTTALATDATLASTHL